ncbi:hypothetical protein Moror_5286 [Moniliophthora roreri MCA 2997]|uniref:DUF6593 domain-containing protein n=2 Tax=Moniliophthora roreri TaxID=221103 RepID=V2WQM2_MONRO|nr:hypothetical protein Moror_5286 [Moniliophthora roreri MCA 2997]KAI3608903.1 hypothetical protein WG66_011049 [Moniliophthora roreri]
MELSLMDSDPWNTVFILPDGHPLYHVETDVGFFSSKPSTIKKIMGPDAADMAIVDSGSWDSLVSVWGRNITPQREGIFSVSESFIASDGKSYKWKVDWDSTVLVINDGSHTLTAAYDSGSLGFFSNSRPPTLNILPHGVQIADEIIATWIYMEQKRRRRNRRQRRRRMNGMMGS